MSFHDHQTVGVLTSRVVSDTSTVGSSLLDLFTDLIPAVFSLLGTLIVMISVGWRLGLIAFTVSPLVYRTARRFRPADPPILTQPTRGHRRTHRPGHRITAGNPHRPRCCSSAATAPCTPGGRSAYSS
jgi:ABC-type multidrug transport system fused ATPase/permease subunit